MITTSVYLRGLTADAAALCKAGERKRLKRKETIHKHLSKFLTLRASPPARFGQPAEDSLAIDEEASSTGPSFNQKSAQKRPT